MLASVVFLIGVELVDIAGMRRSPASGLTSSSSPLMTALTVILVGVEQGIVLAIVASVIDHLRRSYHPNNKCSNDVARTHRSARRPPLIAGTYRLPLQRIAVLRQRRPTSSSRPPR